MLDEFLIDPRWTWIAGICAVLAFVLYVFIERNKLIPPILILAQFIYKIFLALVPATIVFAGSDLLGLLTGLVTLKTTDPNSIWLVLVIVIVFQVAPMLPVILLVTAFSHTSYSQASIYGAVTGAVCGQWQCFYLEH
jgi:hypothetical protein